MPEFKERDVRHLNLRAAPLERKREDDEPAPRSWRDLIAAWLEGVASGATAAKGDDHADDRAIEEPVAPAQIQQLTEALATWTKGRGSRERGQTPPAAMLSRFRRNSLREVLDALGARPDLRAATLAAADPEIAPPVRPRGPRAGKASGEALWRASERRAATLYRRAAGARSGNHDDPAVQEALARCGSGEALPAELRARMERELGVPLGRVRIHTDGVAAAAADAVDAEAFTVGEDVFFAEGKFDPQSTSGRSLIAHELTHVVQSWQGRTASKPAVSVTSDPLEREAETVAAKTVEPKTVEPKSNTSEQQYGGGGAAGQTNQPAAAPGAAGAVTREMFQISSWAAHAAGSWYRENQGSRTMSIISQGIHASASVRATTPEAQHYNVGFVQTIHGSTRQAFYQDDGGAVANSYVVRRGAGMDQRTDIPAPAPWYNGFVHGAASAVSPAMDDYPRFVVPLATPDGATPAHHLGGSESFTTYLVAMQGNDAHTIIYLGNVAWNISWAGRLQTSGDGFPPAYEFGGGHTTIGAAQQNATGGARLSGAAANHGSQGHWQGGGGAAAAGGGGGAANHGGVQRKASGGAAGADPVAIASRGVSGSGARLPHFDAIQQSFGHHDVSGVSSHVGGAAADATRGLAARAYAFGNAVAFEGAPDLHTAAHEAAHVVQQRRGISLAGNLDGGAGDPHERHADAIADAVVAGKSAEALLDGAGGGGGTAVQRKAEPGAGEKKKSKASLVTAPENRLPANPPDPADAEAEIEGEHEPDDKQSLELEPNEEAMMKGVGDAAKEKARKMTGKARQTFLETEFWKGRYPQHWEKTLKPMTQAQRMVWQREFASNLMLGMGMDGSTSKDPHNPDALVGKPKEVQEAVLKLHEYWESLVGFGPYQREVYDLTWRLPDAARREALAAFAKLYIQKLEDDEKEAKKRLPEIKKKIEEDTKRAIAASEAADAAKVKAKAAKATHGGKSKKPPKKAPPAPQAKGLTLHSESAPAPAASEATMTPASANASSADGTEIDTNDESASR